MDKNLRNLILLILGALILVTVLFYFLWSGSAIDGNRVEGFLSIKQLSDKTGCQAPESGSLDDFAKCLKDKGAIFYGAFWCPHCQDEKALFGDSAQYLPYVECSTADGKGQLQVCADKGITVYPTWQFQE